MRFHLPVLLNLPGLVDFHSRWPQYALHPNDLAIIEQAIKMLNRNMDEHPYSPDEERVADWFIEKGGIGGGDDPIGSLLTTYEYRNYEYKILRNALKEVRTFALKLPAELQIELLAVISRSLIKDYPDESSSETPTDNT